MKKVKETIDSTANSRVYRMARRKTTIKCDFCRPHRGCNRFTKVKINHNWKKFRKTQWKT